MMDGNPLEAHGLKPHRAESAVKFRVTPFTRLKEAYKILYRQDLAVRDAIEKMKAELENSPELAHLISFIESTDRGLT